MTHVQQCRIMNCFWIVCFLLGSWVDWNQFLGKPQGKRVVRCTDSKFPKARWFPSNKVESYPSWPKVGSAVIESPSPHYRLRVRVMSATLPWEDLWPLFRRPRHPAQYDTPCMKDKPRLPARSRLIGAGLIGSDSGRWDCNIENVTSYGSAT